MRAPKAWTALLSAALASLGVLVATAPAAGADSRIAWSSFGETRGQIVSANPDGSQRQKVTHPAQDVFDIDAVFSPDGTQIAFQRDHPETEIYEVGIVDAGGENEEILDLGCTDPCTADLMPGWLPDGDRITYTPVIGPFEGPGGAAVSAVLYTADPDGSDVERLSEPGIDGVYEDYHARYSRDGSYLTFLRVRNEPFNFAIFRMDSDGTDVRRLTPWKLDADLADLSLATSGPTEDLLVFETYGHGAPQGKTNNVATVPATCPTVAKCRERIRYVTHRRRGPVANFNPAWSPSGKRIAFTRFKDGGKDRRAVGDIYTIRPDGKGKRPVTTSRRFEFRPDWGRTP
jgi:Tol biopolymer transport system component